MKMSFQFEYTDFFEFKMKIQLYYVKCYIALMTLNLKWKLNLNNASVCIVYNLNSNVLKRS